MSYVFDKLSAIWREHVRPAVLETKGEMFVLHFEAVLEALHSANHRVPSADGVFKGDGINHDPDVCRAIRELVEVVEEMEGDQKKLKGLMDEMDREDN